MSRVTPLRTAAAVPHRIVALGGGTGLPAVLRGLKAYRPAEDDASFLTAVVTMSDDGGSSGRLRESRGLPPPGDVRNCLVALSDGDQLAELFQHRYGGGTDDLGGHSLGNLILVALAERTGCFLKAVEAGSRVLKTAGRILPATTEPVTLRAELLDGSVLTGETRIARADQAIRRVSLDGPAVRPTPGVVESIAQADLVVIGPGSLYTSVVPNLIVPGVGRALHDSRAIVVLVANLVSERGEATGLDLADHIRVIEEHAGFPVLDAVLVNDAPIPEDALERYRAEGTKPLYWPAGRRHRIPVVRRSLLADAPKLRHDPRLTAAGLVEAWRTLSSRRAVSRNS